jgi:hypothetical protein
MKVLRTVVSLLLLLSSASAYASCVTHTIFTADGRMQTCQTCCYGGNCTTHCF